MARLIACASGNFTSSSTWAVADTTFVSESQSTTSTVPTLSPVNVSASFIPGAITIDALLIKITSVSSTQLGTLNITLYNSTDLVDAALVTINVADLPTDDIGWTTFKLASPVLLVAGKSHIIRAQASVSGQTTVSVSSGLLRTLTTAAPAASDQLIISNEYISAGVKNTITVTMDNTSATVFGLTTYVPSISVSGGGTLTWGTTAATNYVLSIKGHVYVKSGATWNQGTIGNRIPASSTAFLYFKPTVSDDSSFLSTSGTANFYGAIKNPFTFLTSSIGGYCSTATSTVTRILGQSFLGMTGTININGSDYTINSVTDANTLTVTTVIGTNVSVVYKHSVTANILHVVDTTGWAVGDILVIAPTTRTYSDIDEKIILTVDSSTQVTLTSACAFSHSGDIPTQAEVQNLTRNVGISGDTNTTRAFFSVNGTTAVSNILNISYSSFYMLTSFSIAQYNLFSGIGMALNNLNGSFSINSTLNVSVSLTYSCIYSLGATSASFPSVMDNVVFVGCNLNLSDGVYVSNIYISGSISSSISTNSSTVSAGAFENITYHSCNSYIQIIMIEYNRNSTIPITGFNVWRNNGHGIYLNSKNVNFEDFIVFGNASSGLNLVNTNNCTFKNFIIASDIACTQVNSVNSTNSSNDNYFDDCSFSPISGIFTRASSIEIVYNTSNLHRNYFKNCLFNALTEMTAQSQLSRGSAYLMHNYNQVVGSHKRVERHGTARSDIVTYKTSSPAETLTPATSTGHFRSTPTQPIALDAGQTATITVYVYKSATYNGSQPRLILNANAAIGFDDNVVLATAVGGTLSWLTLSGTTPAALYDGAFVCYVDCNGTVGTVTVDDWEIS